MKGACADHLSISDDDDADNNPNSKLQRLIELFYTISNFPYEGFKEVGMKHCIFV